MENREVSFQKLLDLLKSEIANISYNVWFSNFELYDITEDTLYFKTDSYRKNYIKQHYIDQINENVVKSFEFPYNVEIISDEDIQEIEASKNQLKKNNIVNKEENIDNNINRVGTNLNPNLTFDNYVVGKTNLEAQLNGLQVAENPGTLYNPLFIYGKSGLGKTHLMHAIGNFIVENSNKKVLYISCEDFTEDFLQICRTTGNESNEIYNKFKDKYRNVDVLIIDDIQRLAKKTATQDEFFNTFESLYKTSKQIIIASDTSPNDLKEFEDRLKTRFVWGLTVTINPPDLELKKKILKNKMAGHEVGKQIPDNVLDYIANNSPNDVRHLEGAINRLYSCIAMFSPPKIDLDFAKESLKDFLGNDIYTYNSIGKIQKAVADYYELTVETLKSKKRKAEITNPRQVAMYLCKLKTEECLEKIGLEFNRDHATVIHGCNKVENELKTNPQLKKDIQAILEKI